MKERGQPVGDVQGARERSAAVTLRDVARRAEVSPATASYALRGDPRIKEDTRRKVRQAAEAIGYARSDAVSRALSAVRARGGKPYRETVAVVQTLEAPVSSGIERQDRLFERGLTVRAAEVGVRLDRFDLRDQPVERIPVILKARGIRSAIVFSFGLNPERLNRMAWALEAVRCVFLGACEPSTAGGVAVACDRFAMGRRGYIAAWRAGYRRVLCVPPPRDLDPGRRFEAGMRFASNSLTVGVPLDVLTPTSIGATALIDRFATSERDTCFIGSAEPEFLDMLSGQGAVKKPKPQPGWIHWHANIDDVLRGITGFDQRDEDQARHAVELAASLLTVPHRSGSGTGAEFLLDPGWIEGTTAPVFRNDHLSMLPERPYATGTGGQGCPLSPSNVDAVPFGPEAEWMRLMRVPSVPPGDWSFHGVLFRLEAVRSGGGGEVAGVALLRSATHPCEAGRRLPTQCAWRVARRVRAVYFLHAAGYTPARAAIARYRFVYRSGQTEELPLVSGKRDFARESQPPAHGEGANIQDWSPDFRQIDTAVARPVCLLDADRHPGDVGYIYTLEWRNPHPRRILDRIEAVVDGDQPAMLVVFAVTVV